MMLRRTGLCLALAIVSGLAAEAGMLGQDTLARARNLYVAAAYDEALVLLDALIDCLVCRVCHRCLSYCNSAPIVSA